MCRRIYCCFCKLRTQGILNMATKGHRITFPHPTPISIFKPLMPPVLWYKILVYVNIFQWRFFPLERPDDEIKLVSITRKYATELRTDIGEPRRIPLQTGYQTACPQLYVALWKRGHCEEDYERMDRCQGIGEAYTQNKRGSLEPLKDLMLHPCQAHQRLRSRGSHR